MAEPLVFDGSPLDDYLQEAAHSSTTTQQSPPPHTPMLPGSFQSRATPDSRTDLFEMPSTPNTVAELVCSLRQASRMHLPRLVHTLRRLLSSYLPTKSRNASRSLISSVPAGQDTLFMEQFKLIICSSFLLTSNLSISFYETETPKRTTLDTGHSGRSQSQASEKHQPRRPSPVVAFCSLPSQKSSPLLASPIVFAFSAIWTASLITALVTTLLAGSGLWLLLLRFSADQLSFELAWKPSDKTATPLRNQTVAARTEQSLQGVTQLVHGFQSFDISVNKAINAVQEVELVSRGFKLTQPLLPISRIEATNSSAWNTRSASTGSHHTIGRASSLKLNGRHATPIEQRSALLPPRRTLQHLRQVILYNLDQTIGLCNTVSASLDDMIDSEELALIKDMYALDESASTDVHKADHPWTSGDYSTTSTTTTSPPPLDTNRGSAWTPVAAATPRKLSNSLRQTADTPGRVFPSPRSGHKRLSLVSDSGSVLNSSNDRYNGASSSLSCRSSAVSDHGNSSITYRSPRLPYVSDKAGPNDSAALKRLSYRSASSAASTSSFNVRSPPLHSALFATDTSVASPPLHPSSFSTIGKTRRGMDLGYPGELPSPIFDDGLSLLSLKSRFEAMHSSRRQLLCRLLALQEASPTDAYWSTICSLMDKVSQSSRKRTDAMKQMITNHMLAVGKRPVVSHPMTAEVAPSPSRIIGHPGLEDRLNAMMLALRSMQAKIRACAEHIHVKPPLGLHGIDADALPTTNAGDDHMERVLSTMQEDLIALSAEWEGSLQIVRKERSRSPSPILLQDDSDAPQSILLQTTDHAAVSSTAKDIPQHDAVLLDGGEASEDDNDDLAALLLGSTSLDALPPPGLEQVYESIAGLAGITDLLDRRATREERIALARQKRQEEAIPIGNTLDSSGMMMELNGVIQSRRAAREQLTVPPTQSEPDNHTTSSNVIALGSPLDLGNAGREGVFGDIYSGGGHHGARRSVSSLDMARARSLQAFDESYSDGVSDRSRSSAEFSFEATPLESVPEDGAALPDSPWLKSTPRADQTPISALSARRQEDSPFDLGAQVAAYARRKAAASSDSA